jgi:cytochrome c oxidase cbb3-type subunit III
MWRFPFGLVLLAAVSLPAQKKYSQTDVEIGSRLYIANCIYCHGPDGDQIPGIDLGHGKFRTASSDEDLVRIIRTGVPEAGMPAQDKIAEPNVKTIVAYLRSLATVDSGDLPAGGDAGRGRMVVESKGCLNCHRIKDNGSRFGPDLTDVGALRRVVEIQQSILEPDKTILPQHRMYRVVTRDGATMTARILNQDSFTIQLIDSKQRLLSFSKADLREFTALRNSPMPSYRDKLSQTELADVVSYLVSLKGI